MQDMVLTSNCCRGQTACFQDHCEFSELLDAMRILKDVEIVYKFEEVFTILDCCLVLWDCFHQFLILLIFD